MADTLMLDDIKAKFAMLNNLLMLEHVRTISNIDDIDTIINIISKQFELSQYLTHTSQAKFHTVYYSSMSYCLTHYITQLANATEFTTLIEQIGTPLRAAFSTREVTIIISGDGRRHEIPGLLWSEECHNTGWNNKVVLCHPFKKSDTYLFSYVDHSGFKQYATATQDNNMIARLVHVY